MPDREPNIVRRDVVDRVKWFNKKMGHGFLVNPEGENVFLHDSRVVGEGRFPDICGPTLASRRLGSRAG